MLIPSYTSILIVFLSPGPFPEQLHPSLQPLEIFSVPQSWERSPLSSSLHSPLFTPVVLTACLSASLPHPLSEGPVYVFTLPADNRLSGFGGLRFNCGATLDSPRALCLA